MKILVLNCGSSSLKYQLFNMDNERVLAQGVVERIGLNNSILTHKKGEEEKYKINIDFKNHKEALTKVLQLLTSKEQGVLKSLNEIHAVGHRVVHGGEKYSKAVLIDEDVKKSIKALFSLAPLHNPANLIGIEICEDIMKNTPMVALFDTAFHQSMNKEEYLYAIPYELYKENGIRKYGFHGSSHKYVSEKAAELLKKDIKDLKIISCHLGNGASICAIKDGKSFDTTMGFSPLDGLVMGTRSGSIDPTIPIYLMKNNNLSIEEVDNLLNKKSGVLGISEVSSDFRDIEEEAMKGNEKASLALDIFHYKIKTQIGSYIAALNGVDIIIFTAGVGENGPETREAILKDMEFFGIVLDKEKNKVRGKIQEISAENSKVKVFVIPTNEELVIARETKKIIAQK
ncbi:MAG: acetate/propionate family kinase [Clostridium sp.]|jgi:acetate kinase